MSRYYINVRKQKAHFEPETLAFQSRVIEDGGKILDIEKLDNFYKANKAIDKYDALQFAVSKQFGYKLNGSDNIIKIYDASKNGNDLDISRGTVAEDIEHDMFFLNNVFFKDETVTFDVIGDKFTFTTDVNHPDPFANPLNYLIGFSSLSFFYGGATPHVGWYDLDGTNLYSRANNILTSDDIGEKRLIDFRYNKGVERQIRKDKEDKIVHGAFNISLPKPNKITYGGRADESTVVDADCYLNNSFFYNDYLTDEELEIINEI